MAEETSITGSIGVIAQVLTFEGLMDKVGVKPVTLVATGSPEKNVANDMFRTWDDADKAKIRLMLDSAYATFNQRVKAGRGKVITDPTKIDALANGSIYTAKQAKDSGLIDGIGYLDNAIAQAETLGGTRQRREFRGDRVSGREPLPQLHGARKEYRCFIAECQRDSRLGERSRLAARDVPDELMTATDLRRVKLLIV